MVPKLGYKNSCRKGRHSWIARNETMVECHASWISRSGNSYVLSEPRCRCNVSLEMESKVELLLFLHAIILPTGSHEREPNYSQFALGKHHRFPGLSCTIQNTVRHLELVRSQTVAHVEFRIVTFYFLAYLYNALSCFEFRRQFLITRYFQQTNPNFSSPTYFFFFCEWIHFWRNIKTVHIRFFSLTFVTVFILSILSVTSRFMSQFLSLSKAKSFQLVRLFIHFQRFFFVCFVCFPVIVRNQSMYLSSFVSWFCKTPETFFRSIRNF